MEQNLRRRIVNSRINSSPNQKSLKKLFEEGNSCQSNCNFKLINQQKNLDNILNLKTNNPINNTKDSNKSNKNSYTNKNTNFNFNRKIEFQGKINKYFPKKVSQNNSGFQKEDSLISISSHAKANQNYVKFTKPEKSTFKIDLQEKNEVVKDPQITIILKNINGTNSAASSTSFTSKTSNHNNRLEKKKQKCCVYVGQKVIDSDADLVNENNSNNYWEKRNAMIREYPRTPFCNYARDQEINNKFISNEMKTKLNFEVESNMKRKNKNRSKLSSNSKKKINDSPSKKDIHLKSKLNLKEGKISEKRDDSYKAYSLKNEKVNLKGAATSKIKISNEIRNQLFFKNLSNFEQTQDIRKKHEKEKEKEKEKEDESVIKLTQKLNSRKVLSPKNNFN